MKWSNTCLIGILAGQEKRGRKNIYTHNGWQIPQFDGN